MEDLEIRTDPPSTGAAVDQALDRLSLTQALKDFEVANGRVIDLTERLVITAEELLATREEVDAVRAERDELRAELDDLTRRYEELRDTHARTLERKSVKLGQAVWQARRSIPRPRRDG